MTRELDFGEDGGWWVGCCCEFSDGASYACYDVSGGTAQEDFAYEFGGWVVVRCLGLGEG